jgi:hypothetical protein
VQISEKAKPFWSSGAPGAPNTVSWFVA